MSYMGRVFTFKFGCLGYECNCVAYTKMNMPRVENPKANVINILCM
jgi:hypothetical protein